MTNSPQANPVLDPLWKRIQETHERALGGARQAIMWALECGRMLLQARDTVGDEDWYLRLEGIGIPLRTASRYMHLVKKFDSRARMLEDGITLTDLYRELGLITPTTGGGRRLGDSELQRRKFDPEYQLRRHYGEFQGWLEKLDKCGEFNPFAAASQEEAAKVDLEATERRLERALELVREAKAENGAVEVEASRNTEDGGQTTDEGGKDAN